MHKILTSNPPNYWLRRLGNQQRQVCLFTGNGEGWATTLAWNPSAQCIIRTDDTLGTSELSAFIAKQTSLGRKVLGYISYDTGYNLLDVAQTAKDDLGLPTIYFLAFENYLELTSDTTTVRYKDPAFLDEIIAIQNSQPNTAALKLDQNFHPVLSREQYDSAFDKIKQYILDGHVYQINLTHRLEARTSTPNRTIFSHILDGVSTGFMAYLEGPDFAIHSASPERFIHITDETIETFPIKGTRPRTGDPKQDEMSSKELLGSRKDAAELNMITDLLRNDLGRICQPGSVQLLSERDILLAPKVIHTFSHVIGQLQPKVRPIEALLSMFPGGSITGCPKKRAVEIIDELEPVTRSVYCGSIVAIEPNGHLDSSIAIRTIIQKGNRLILPVGGGIVHASKGDEEYQETLDKAKALINALSG